MSDDFSQKEFEECISFSGQIGQYLRSNLDDVSRLRYRKAVTPLEQRITDGDLTALEPLMIKMADWCAIQVGRNPQSPTDLYVLFASFYGQTGRDFQDASGILKTGIEHHPEDASLHLHVGKFHMREAYDVLERKDYDGVISLVEEATPYIHRARKLDHECEGADFTVMINAMERLKRTAQRKKAGNFESFREEQEDFEDASQFLKKRIEQNPHDAQLYLHLGKFYIEEIRRVRERRDYEKVISLVEEASPYIHRAQELDPKGADIAELIDSLKSLKMVTCLLLYGNKIRTPLF